MRLFHKANDHVTYHIIEIIAKWLYLARITNSYLNIDLGIKSGSNRGSELYGDRKWHSLAQDIGFALVFRESTSFREDHAAESNNPARKKKLVKIRNCYIRSENINSPIPVNSSLEANLLNRSAMAHGVVNSLRFSYWQIK